jgi:hypothetical protein
LNTTKFRLSDKLPKTIEKYKTLSAAELSKFILQDFNKDVKPNTITTFLKRHPQLRKEYEEVFSSAANSQIEVSKDLFMNGNFKECPSVKKWIIEKTTLVSPLFLQGHVGALKRICQGIYFMRDSTTKKLTEVQIPNWTPKSPERITVEQFQEYIGYVHKAGNCTNTYRIAFRDFILSRDEKTVSTLKISGEVASGKHVLGRWKYVDVPTEDIYAILNYVKERYFVGYAAAFASYKTNARHNAVLTQFLKTKLVNEDGQLSISITDKGFHRKGRQSSPRLVSPDLLVVLEECWRLNGNNAFAGLDDALMMKLLKEAYMLYLKRDIDVNGKIAEYSALELAMAEPFHFWHHMFGRKMLIATGYNYTVVAALGGWGGDTPDETMLHKVYGAAPLAMLRKEGLAVLPQI